MDLNLKLGGKLQDVSKKGARNTSEALTRTQTYEDGKYPGLKKPQMKTQKEEDINNDKQKRAVVVDEVTGVKKTYTYNAQKIVGNGTFGVVFQATVQETGELVAIKKVFQDKRYRNREYQILKELEHPNVTVLRNAFYTQGDTADEVYLNVVMDYIPETAAKIIKYYSKMKQAMPTVLIKLYSYQLLRSLAYIKELGICHRDIKPQNILVNPSTHVLKLCDFGSAKKLVKGEPNIAYICSRYYRAPELIFGATDYGFGIDMWSAGCVIAEMILGEPFFPGESGLDQLIEIIKVLGTPSKEQVLKMNPNSPEEFKFPVIKGQPFSKVFKKADPLLIDFLSKILIYEPKERLNPIQALLHPFFDDLRHQNFQIQGLKTTDLFDFTKEEITAAGSYLTQLTPQLYRKSS